MDIPNKLITQIRDYRSPTRAAENLNIQYPIIGIGAGRLLLEIDANLVIKISPTPMGDHQNKTEHSVWESATDEARKHLAPVIDIASDNSWLVMKKVDDPTDTYEAFATDDEKRIKTILQGYGIYLNEVEVGFYQGRLVACDYGNCESF